MKIWKWSEAGLNENHAVSLSDNPLVIICGGGFNVDDPSLALHEPDPAIERFFDFIVTQVKTDKATFRRLICGTLEGKLELNYFLLRKLVGLIDAKPGADTYPAQAGQGYSPLLDIMEVSYTSTSQCFYDTQELYKNPAYYSSDAATLAALIFTPLFKRFGQDEAGLANALKRITFFGISHGSNFLLELENAAAALFAEAGYDSGLLRQLYSIVISSIAPVRNAHGPGFSAVYFEGSNDALAQWLNPFKMPAPPAGELKMTKLAAHRLLVQSQVTKSATRWLEVIPEFDYYWIDNDKAAHYTPFYCLRSLPENIQPDLVERALRNAIGRYEWPLADMGALFALAPPLNPQVDAPAKGPFDEMILRAARDL